MHFSAFSPYDGVLDSPVLPWVNAETMSLFLTELAQRHADELGEPRRAGARQRRTTKRMPSTQSVADMGAQRHAAGLPFLSAAFEAHRADKTGAW
jgi:hypothetical protein